MGLTVALEDARAACAASVEAFVRVVEGLDELELLDASRCRGWTRLDVVVHVLAGWQEMLGGLVSPVEPEPTVDAASYWTAFAEQYGDEDPVLALMAQRRRTAAHARPSTATAQLRDVAQALLRGIEACRDEHLLWQGHVFTAGDFLTTWAVEDVVHQLDLLVDEPLPASALALARASVEALAGGPLPADWDDAEAVLAGAGRVPAPAAGDGPSSRAARPGLSPPLADVVSRQAPACLPRPPCGGAASVGGDAERTLRAEQAAGHGREAEEAQREVRDVAVADRLLARQAGARAAGGDVTRVDPVQVGVVDAGTPHDERDAVVGGSGAGGVPRRARYAAVIGGEGRSSGRRARGGSRPPRPPGRRAGRAPARRRGTAPTSSRTGGRAGRPSRGAGR
jgi:hypothetical protein